MFRVGRFGVVPAAWLGRGDLGVNEIAVLACLSTYADENGWCYPSQSTIARQIKRSRPTVSAIIRSLVELGLVEQHRQFNENGGERSCLYRIRYDMALADGNGNGKPPPVSPPTPPVGRTTPPVEPLTGPVASSTPPVAPSTESNPTEHIPPGESPPAIANSPLKGSLAQKPKLPVPDEWKPSEADAAWALQKFPDVDPTAEAERFVLMAQAQGWTYANTAAGWRLWLMNQFDSKKERPNAAPRSRHEGRSGKAARRTDPGKPEDSGSRSDKNRDIVGKTRERFLSRRSP